ncbi:hypothetical protein PHLCEN_2v10989 [Hermanssonia centrifuga]|uniref:Uncharacterized protein n=1 Tax=Hermanssonia centrifuga TaxID=98765 RepID=A0A2R6NLA1_9APHY|nr:hypothetical protein PHLCEN_2v10989 [Hermanssonia centrifuga]
MRRRISSLSSSVILYKVIAAHTFWVLFLRWDLRRYVMIATMIFGWSLIGTLVIAGPATGGVKVNGPFYVHFSNL